MSDQKINNLIGWLLGAIAFGVYFFTLEPVASFWDSGEYIASSYKLEIPHPPGAPLFLLLGRLFSFLSFGDDSKVAMAINSLSALSSSLTITFLYWTIVRVVKKIPSLITHKKELAIGGGVIGSLSFAFTNTFWLSATETELYGIATLFIALVFWAILKWEEQFDKGDGNRWLILICFIIGLSVGIHLLSLLAIPSIGLVYYFKKYKKTTKLGILIALLSASAFLLFVLYGLVTMADISKYLEIWLVNSFSFPVGSGVGLLAVLLIGSLIFAIRYSIKKKLTGLNTLVLGVVFVIIGYSSYGVVLIRANYGPPINQNDPKDVLGLIYYLNLEQYPTRPLLYGNYFNAPLIGYEKGKPIYEQVDGEYRIKDYKLQQNFAEGYQTIFPRAYNQQKPEYAGQYAEIMGLKAQEKPKFSDNLNYLIRHQMGEMYLRYFMWNFAGKSGSKEGAGWLSPLDAFDEIPNIWKNDAGRDNYFMIPLLIGLIGMIFLFNHDKRQFLVIGVLFFMTGFALVLYLNAPPSEPRERDYIYVGSYYAFAIWLGLGIVFLVNKLSRIITSVNKRTVLKLSFLLSLAIPLLLVLKNYDDHDRSERYFSVEQARNTLAACEENAILFTGGDNDTYPLWYVQEVEGYRNDVRVVVLSYSNVDWYINALFDQKNNSKPLPLSLNKTDYKQGALIDYAPLIEAEELAGKTISARSYLNLIKKKHQAIVLKNTWGDMALIPSKTLFSQMDTSKLSLRDDIPKIAKNKFDDRFEFEIKGKGLEKKDLLILDILDSNHWQRPIYFNYTSLSQVNMDFTGKTVQVGNLFRLLPLRDDVVEGEHLIDTEKMYANLIDKSTYTNLNKQGIHYEGNYNFFVKNQRKYFNDLTYQLIKDGDLDTAKKVIDKSLELFPSNIIPIDIGGVELVRNAILVNEIDTANRIADDIYVNVEEWLSYADYQGDLSEARETRLGLYLMNEFARTFMRTGDEERASKYGRLIEKYYQPS